MFAMKSRFQMKGKYRPEIDSFIRIVCHFDSVSVKLVFRELMSCKSFYFFYIGLQSEEKSFVKMGI